MVLCYLINRCPVATWRRRRRGSFGRNGFRVFGTFPDSQSLSMGHARSTRLRVELRIMNNVTSRISFHLARKHFSNNITSWGRWLGARGGEHAFSFFTAGRSPSTSEPSRALLTPKYYRHRTVTARILIPTHDFTNDFTNDFTTG